MTVDRYTKLVLTVIAACLLWHDAPSAISRTAAGLVAVTDDGIGEVARSRVRPSGLRLGLFDATPLVSIVV